MMRKLDAWRLRRLAVLVFAAMLAVSVVMFLGMQVSETHQGTVELLNGQPDTAPLDLPLALFVIGGAGLMAALGWHPQDK